MWSFCELLQNKIKNKMHGLTSSGHCQLVNWIISHFLLSSRSNFGLFFIFRIICQSQISLQLQVQLQRNKRLVKFRCLSRLVAINLEHGIDTGTSIDSGKMFQTRKKNEQQHRCGRISWIPLLHTAFIGIQYVRTCH